MLLSGDAPTLMETSHSLVSALPSGPNAKLPPVVFLLDGIGKNPIPAALRLRDNLPDMCARVWDRCVRHLRQEHGIDLSYSAIEAVDLKSDNAVVIHTLVLVAVQLCQLRVLQFLGVEASCYLGHSTGETVMAYVDGLYTLEQVLSIAYLRASAALESSKRRGTPAVMTVVSGVAAEVVEKSIAPFDVEVVCRNHGTNVTVAGPLSAVENALAALKSTCTEANSLRIVPLETDGVVYHRYDFFPPDILARLRRSLQQVVPISKRSSKKWISSSQPAVLKPVIGANYYAHNTVSRVEFEQACRRIPEGALVIEIGAMSMWKNTITKKLPVSAAHCSLAQKSVSQIYKEIARSGVPMRDVWDAEAGSRVHVEELFRFQHEEAVIVHRRQAPVTAPSLVGPKSHPFDHVFSFDLAGPMHLSLCILRSV